MEDAAEQGYVVTYSDELVRKPERLELKFIQQSNSASYVKRAPKRLSQASTTSTRRPPAPTLAPAAMRPSTLLSTSSSLVAAGLHSSMPSLVR